jgi:hypothetical protein
MSGKANQVVASQQKKNLYDLESFCHYCKNKYPCDKPMTKVDASILLLLLNDKMTPEKAEYFRSQMSRASGREYKSDGIISILSESLINVFLSALKPEETDSGPRYRMKSLKTLLNGYIEDQQELEQQLENIKQEKGYITASEHKEELEDLEDQYREKNNDLKRECDKSDTRIQFLEEKYQHQLKQKDQMIKNLQDKLFNQCDTQQE